MFFKLNLIVKTAGTWNELEHMRDQISLHLPRIDTKTIQSKEKFLKSKKRLYAQDANCISHWKWEQWYGFL